MTIRVAKRGISPGKPFLGCTGYPVCKNTATINSDCFESIHSVIYELSYRHAQDFHFSEELLNTLLYKLNFTDYKSFYIWILNEMTKYHPHDMHNLPVGSPYCFHLASIIKFIKGKYEVSELNKLQDDIFSAHHASNSSIDEWKRLIDN